MFKLNNNRCVGHVSHLEQMTKPWHNSADRPQCRCEDIKMGIKEAKCMCTGYKTFPHFIETEDSLLRPQGSLNPAHIDKPYLNKIYLYTIILLLPWFPKQPHHFSIWNESVTWFDLIYYYNSKKSIYRSNPWIQEQSKRELGSMRPNQSLYK